MFWSVFWAVLAANALTTGTIAAIAWIDERKRIKRSNEETYKTKAKVRKPPKEISAKSAGDLKKTDIALNCEEWVDWIPEDKYLEKGYYDYAAECHDILEEVREQLLEVREYNPVEEYAPGGNLGPVEPEDVEGIIAETEILAVIMKHHGASLLETGKVCKYYQVLLVADQFELDWKQAAKDYAIDFLTKKYFGEVYNK